MADESNSMQASQGHEAAWKQLVVKFQKPSRARALWQIIDTIGPYAAIWYLMYLSLFISWWLVLPLADLVRMFFGRRVIFFYGLGARAYFQVVIAHYSGWGVFC